MQGFGPSLSNILFIYIYTEIIYRVLGSDIRPRLQRFLRRMCCQGAMSSRQWELSQWLWPGLSGNQVRRRLYIYKINQVHRRLYIYTLNQVHQRLFIYKLNQVHRRLYIYKLNQVHRRLYIYTLNQVHRRLYIYKLNQVHRRLYIYTNSSAQKVIHLHWHINTLNQVHQRLYIPNDTLTHLIKCTEGCTSPLTVSFLH